MPPLALYWRATYRFEIANSNWKQCFYLISFSTILRSKYSDSFGKLSRCQRRPCKKSKIPKYHLHQKKLNNLLYTSTRGYFIHKNNAVVFFKDSFWRWNADFDAIHLYYHKRFIVIICKKTTGKLKLWWICNKTVLFGAITDPG